MKLYQILPTGSILTEIFPRSWEFPYHEARLKQKLNLLIKIFISPNYKNHGFETTTVPIKWEDYLTTVLYFS